MARHVLLALDWYDHRLHRGVARVAAREGWHLTCPSGVPGFQPVPTAWRGDGAITLTGDRGLARLRARGVRVVDIGLSASARVPRTIVDNAAVAELAFRHLRSRGWRRLACLTQEGVRMFDERVDAFIARCADDGIECPRWPVDGLARRLRAAAPVAVFAAQDSLGAAAIAAAREARLEVPSDVAVVGVDDVDLICEALPVPLASVDTDQEGLGIAAAERLARLLAGRSDAGRVIRHAPRAVVARASAEAFGAQHPGLRAALELAHRAPGSGVRGLARAADLSPQGLDLVCRRELGMAPGALLRRIRLRAAGEALGRGATLAEAAAAACLSSASGLCALVRRECGMPTTRWRQRFAGAGSTKAE